MSSVIHAVSSTDYTCYLEVVKVSLDRKTDLGMFIPAYCNGLYSDEFSKMLQELIRGKVKVIGIAENVLPVFSGITFIGMGPLEMGYDYIEFTSGIFAPLLNNVRPIECFTVNDNINCRIPFMLKGINCECGVMSYDGLVKNLEDIVMFAKRIIHTFKGLRKNGVFLWLYSDDKLVYWDITTEDNAEITVK